MSLSEPLPRYARLPPRFDAAALGALLDCLPAEAWARHFNTGHYQGEWRGVALIAPAEALTPLAPPGRLDTVVATPWLARFPAWRAVLARIEAPIRSARLLALGAGARILEHRDPDLGAPDGDVRLHVPLRTHPQVEFVLDGEAVPMAEGECWMLDLSRPHRVDNDSDRERVHLVVDVARCDWLSDAIAAGLSDTPAARPSRAARELAQLRRLIHADRALTARLAALEQADAFIDAVLPLAAGHGLRLNADDLRAAMRQGRRDWNEQWRA
ncbi:aspartyl/asparaginyl beta-hydroxylase domain-containing protein [Chitiniphilus shinanonensis]|uniref:aspartyl/asparaginyl beta-hydroxylase domain-containing protein n=1 Tax=Chitiniphilus shinanonensis TaxID=553088 RepID=UPI00303D92B8